VQFCRFQQSLIPFCSLFLINETIEVKYCGSLLQTGGFLIPLSNCGSFADVCQPALAYPSRR